MKERKCPACGFALQADMSICPECRLEGLNQLFLSRTDYEKWVREVLEPHMATLAPKVFAGKGFGLILTGRGELYGIGENYSGQIDEDGSFRFEQPHLMAKDVVSAAAGWKYSIYVTRDGQAHLRGRGELADRFCGFSGAIAVYADGDDCFWIVDKKAQVWGFGCNEHGQLHEKRTVSTCQLPEAIGTTGYHYEYEFDEVTYSHPTLLYVRSIVWWEENGVRTDRDEGPMVRFQTSDEFRKLTEQYGYANLQIELNETYLGMGSPIEGYGPPKRYRYCPVVYVMNNFLYEPVLCPNAQWMFHTPHRRGSRPELLTHWANWENMPAVKKRAGYWVCLMEDGAVEVEDEGRLEWLEQPVADIAVGDSAFGDYYSFCMFACKNGDILWSNSLTDVIEGTMNRCNLPKQK